ANMAIHKRLIIKRKHVSLNKVQPDPSRCYNYQIYPKLFHCMKNYPNLYECSTCGNKHPNHEIHDCPITELEKQYCVSCDTKGHSSWSHTYPTHLKEKKKS
ncbi:hypothetical protein HD554DRAFT_2020215, partial [Boletus coccyginus]